MPTGGRNDGNIEGGGALRVMSKADEIEALAGKIKE